LTYLTPTLPASHPPHPPLTHSLTKAAVAKLKTMGVLPFPYINGRIFDVNSVSWKEDEGESDVLLIDEIVNRLYESYIVSEGWK
jgi:hypothetical protein